MDAIITAGGRPKPEEPLYPLTQGAPKAMIDIAGKPMIQWVIDALCQARLVDRIVVIGLSPESHLTSAKPLEYIPDQGDMLANIRIGVKKVVELNPQAVFSLLVSSDIPTVTPEALDWVIDTTMQTADDIYYNVVSRPVMEARFPGSRRSFIRLKDIEVCGGDVNVVRCSLAASEGALWEDLIASRKNVLKQAAIIGFDTLLLLLLKAISLQNAVEKVSSRLKIKGRAIVCPYAEVGMDVDKPNQLELVRADLSARLSAST